MWRRRRRRRISFFSYSASSFPPSGLPFTTVIMIFFQLVLSSAVVVVVAEEADIFFSFPALVATPMRMNSLVEGINNSASVSRARTLLPKTLLLLVMSQTKILMSVFLLSSGRPGSHRHGRSKSAGNCCTIFVFFPSFWWCNSCRPTHFSSSSSPGKCSGQGGNLFVNRWIICVWNNNWAAAAARRM